MNWYYVDEGKQAGPVSDEQLNEMFRSGKLKPGTLVWREGMADWAPYGDVRGGMVSTGSTEMKPEAVCAECGKIFPVDETIRYGDVRVCAACKPVFLQKLQEGAALSAGGMRYAGFWIRFASKMLDIIIVGVPMMIVMGIAMFSLFHNLTRQRTVGAAPPTLPVFFDFIQIGFFLIQAAYVIFFLGKYGATPGQMVCKVHVVTSEGGKISYGRATGRFFAEMLSGLICYIGYIMVAFDGQKRALHDHICNTRVVYK